ncbi:neuropeptide F receptor-like [Ornithodoros turicata]|uniref:neuropeptide F receptor-like n=1 Tax=Ornithodoros turicata TaxID=34597 RepID=UPI00313A34EC
MILLPSTRSCNRPLDCSPCFLQSELPFLELKNNVTQTARYDDNSSQHDNLSTVREQIKKYLHIRAIDGDALVGLLVAYVVLIILGAMGNCLVCVAVARKPRMRTARNMFIINLAISDLVLCLFTMPFSLVEIVLKFWPLGVVTCKMVSGLQATSVYVSTISITAIALDRYKAIVYPNMSKLVPSNAICAIVTIWATALLLSLPLFLYRSVDHHMVRVKDHGVVVVDYLDYCLEKWPIAHGRALYSVFSMVFQYVLPVVLVSVAYLRIYLKLKYRVDMKSRQFSTDRHRMHRTNLLLLSITLIFCICWLPLNIFNIVGDFRSEIFKEHSSQLRIVFAVCHMVGMSSACSNPILYGWLNSNFREEFERILGECCCCFQSSQTPSGGDTMLVPMNMTNAFSPTGSRNMTPTHCTRTDRQSMVVVSVNM